MIPYEYQPLMQLIGSVCCALLAYRQFIGPLPRLRRRRKPPVLTSALEEQIRYRNMLKSSALMEHELKMMPHSSTALAECCEFCAHEKRQKAKRAQYRRPATPAEEMYHESLKAMRDYSSDHKPVTSMSTITAASISSDRIDAIRITSGFIRTGVMTPKEAREFEASWTAQNEEKPLQIMYLPKGAEYREIR